MLAYRSIAAVVFALMVVSPAGAEGLELHEPGQPVATYFPDGKTTPEAWLRHQKWYSVTIHDSALRLDAITKTREPDWLEVGGKADARWDVLKTRFKPVGFTLQQPRDALFALRIVGDGGDGGDEGVGLEPGKRPSVLRRPELLKAGWRKSFYLGADTWTLSTDHQKRPDGKLLAGSMRLLLTDSKGGERELLPPAHGMAFSKQELMWLGDLNADKKPDAVVRRTWVTGEIDYVLVVGAALRTLYIDPDRPYRSFSSGVEDSLAVSRHRSEAIALPNGRFGTAAFTISDTTWNRAIGISAESVSRPQLPKVIADRQLELDGERIRFTFEYVPRVQCCEAQGASSSTEASIFGGEVLMKVHFRNRSQVLMQIGALEDRLRVQVGKNDGRLAIHVYHVPHYNNSFTLLWVMPDEVNGRFRRLMVDHSQGC